MIGSLVHTVKVYLLLIIGILLLSNGVFGVPKPLQSGIFYLFTGIILFIIGVHTIIYGNSEVNHKPDQ